MRAEGEIIIPDTESADYYNGTALKDRDTTIDIRRLVARTPYARINGIKQELSDIKSV